MNEKLSFKVPLDKREVEITVDINDETKCSNYINKSIREFNLEYIELANKKYFSEKGKNSKNARRRNC